MSAIAEIDELLKERFAVHPYIDGIGKDNVKYLLTNYLAMSQAFPYIQAGSQYGMIASAIRNGHDIPREFELTTVVGNFLSWDETGGHQALLAGGLPALPSILDAGKFHAHVLRKDIETLLGEEDVKPDYGDATKQYLLGLMAGLSDFDHLVRLAHMIAFEKHAFVMIATLQDSLAKLFEVEREKLAYFEMHVGGDDPAEGYHVEMTESLIKALVKSEADAATFRGQVVEAYGRNVAWCESTKHPTDDRRRSAQPTSARRQRVDLSKYKAISFDCYGTLIDWEGPILTTLRGLQKAGRHPPQTDAELFGMFLEVEGSLARRNPTWNYSVLLGAAYLEIARAFGTPASAGDAASFGGSIGSWPPFDDAERALSLLGRGRPLIILSNIDNRSIELTKQRLRTEFFATYTAESIGTYKPDPRNFEYLLGQLANHGIGASELLHVSVSLFHDHEPARRLGIDTCWINRAGTPNGTLASPPGFLDNVTPTFTFASLDELVDSCHSF